MQSEIKHTEITSELGRPYLPNANFKMTDKW